MAKIKVVYGTGGGNTKLVCDKVEQIFLGKGHEVTILEAKVTEPKDVGPCDLLIFAAPTHGHGDLERYMMKFMEKIKEGVLNLKGQKVSIIGLGDPKYDPDYHLEGVRIIFDIVKEQGVEMLYMPLRISRSPYVLLNNHVARWAETICEKLSELK
jgi:flavodoxin